MGGYKKTPGRLARFFLVLYLAGHLTLFFSPVVRTSKRTPTAHQPKQPTPLSSI